MARHPDPLVEMSERHHKEVPRREKMRDSLQGWRKSSIKSPNPNLDNHLKPPTW